MAVASTSSIIVPEPVELWSKSIFDWHLQQLGLTADITEGRNPALALFREFVQKHERRIGSFAYFDHPLTRSFRRQLCSRYSWAIPDGRALRRIASYSPLVEIGAGTGYWASLIAHEGADIIAYDTRPIKPGHKNQWVADDATSFFPVRRGGAAVLRNVSPERTLFLCWPPHGSAMASTALKAFRGDRLVYIGEDDGGCCADERFFRHLDLYWTKAYTSLIPSWDTINDYLSVFERD